MTLLAATTSALVATAQGREAVTNPLEYLLYGPEGGGFSCMVGEPHDLEGYRYRADAIVRVRLGSGFVETQRFVDGGDEVWAFRRATVLDTFKTDENGPAIGESITIVEWRGWDPPRFRLLGSFSPWFETLLPRHDWILFLERNNEMLSVVLSEEGAFEIEDGLIDMHTHSQWAQSWRRQPARVLVEALRSNNP
jgi:hypothetical protein